MGAFASGGCNGSQPMQHAPGGNGPAACPPVTAWVAGPGAADPTKAATSASSRRPLWHLPADCKCPRSQRGTRLRPAGQQGHHGLSHPLQTSRRRPASQRCLTAALRGAMVGLVDLSLLMRPTSEHSKFAHARFLAAAAPNAWNSRTGFNLVPKQELNQQIIRLSRLAGPSEDWQG